MTKEYRTIIDPRLDGQCIQVFKSAERLRAFHNHELITPETTLLALSFDPSVHNQLNHGIPNPSLLENYIKIVPPERFKQNPNHEQKFWDNYVEWAINQSVKKGQLVRVPNLVDYLYLTDPIVEFRFAITRSNPMQLTTDEHPGSTRRVYRS